MTKRVRQLNQEVQEDNQQDSWQLQKGVLGELEEGQLTPEGHQEDWRQCKCKLLLMLGRLVEKVKRSFKGVLDAVRHLQRDTETISWTDEDEMRGDTEGVQGIAGTDW